MTFDVAAEAYDRFMGRYSRLPFVAAVQARLPDVDVHLGAAERLPLPDDAFDVAFAQRGSVTCASSSPPPDWRRSRRRP